MLDRYYVAAIVAFLGVVTCRQVVADIPSSLNVDVVAQYVVAIGATLIATWLIIRPRWSWVTGIVLIGLGWALHEWIDPRLLWIGAVGVGVLAAALTSQVMLLLHPYNNQT